MDEEIASLLQNITGKEHIKLVSRGNKAIQYALRIAKKLGKKKLFIQDQGGWITYKQFGTELKFDVTLVETDYGLVDAQKLSVDAESVLLINSLTGYFAEQDMDKIYNACFNAGCLVINDISGSISTEMGKIGDILVCSFGSDKPLNYGKGGLIAVENKEWFSLAQILEEDFGKDFEQKLLDLEERLTLLRNVTQKIKKDLGHFDIVHKNKGGINVVIRYGSEDEKQKLIDYSKKNNYEYTECPRSIRVTCDAISIEVKRL
ncbi:MAG TPA: DegT/DnrJ/EryC1/StrS family aminotransferase [Candidatus Nanoarchaeia archaeon]|nr:DegT/DnrJ/EryC1/StrS family aminotransferase [Candidatus Nanoarchaeia archaeon]